MIVVVSNDIISYEKEVIQDGNPNNLLHSIGLYEQRDLLGSYLSAVAMIENSTAELLAIQARSDGDIQR